MNLAHVALWTRDLDSAAAFWESYFNATVGAPYYSARRLGFVSRFVSLPGCASKIELMTGPWITESEAGDSVGWDHIAISLGSKDEVDRLARICKEDGLLESGPRMTGDGYYEAVIRTTDGTAIEVTS
ncbi:VOC family protein [Silvimonas amylolytica]|uniref:Bleomycin resistance protein n=1 Tax=Silvimonas amylolytica TaxID=449663 RepID=A0ABQ2PIX6_9NEIS|nr:VOC family protein [Silvimonas amylolytica]GGP25313.1 bleomycin resistance protein [Silvimonas amylolytica]